jgi:hypothetical protein
MRWIIPIPAVLLFPQTLTRAIAELRRTDVTRVIAGHDVESTASGVRRSRFTMSDLQEYADFNHDFLESVQDALRAGKSAAEAAATLQLPERYKDYDLSRRQANVEAIYKELKR